MPQSRSKSALDAATGGRKVVRRELVVAGGNAPALLHCLILLKNRSTRLRAEGGSVA
jgi:hypothetical protein